MFKKTRNNLENLIVKISMVSFQENFGGSETGPPLTEPVDRMLSLINDYWQQSLLILNL